MKLAESSHLHLELINIWNQASSRWLPQLTEQKKATVQGILEMNYDLKW